MLLNGNYNLDVFTIQSFVSGKVIVITRVNTIGTKFKVDIKNKKGELLNSFIINRNRFKRLLNKHEILENTSGLRREFPWTKLREDKEVIKAIRKIMLPICVCNNGIDGAYRPIKGTTRVECMNALGKIQQLLREAYGNKWL